MRHLLRALAARHDPLSDVALLGRFARDRDPAAFEVLVWRHGGMVLGVCRRHLRDAHLAEDAFQATFLVLARQAATVRGDTLAGFLHRVARRTAVRAAVRATRRRETPLAAEPAANPLPDAELAAVLDAEIDRLPDRLRQVVVLCYLDGRSTEDAAARLGVPRGTVLSRLHTARAKLAARLTRRGVTPPAVGLTAVLTAETVAGGVAVCGGTNGAAFHLANEVLAMTTRKTVLAAAVGLVLAGGAGTGVGVLSAQSGGPPAGKEAASVTAADTSQPAATAKPSPTVEALLADLDARIAQATGVEAAPTALNQRIKVSEGAVRYFESELVRLTARRSSLEAQAPAMTRSEAEQTTAQTARELAEGLAANPEYAAKARVLADLWHTCAQAEAAGAVDAGLKGRVTRAERELTDVRARLTVSLAEASRERRDAAARLVHRDTAEALKVTASEIESVQRSRKAEEQKVIDMAVKLKAVGGTPGLLQRLQTQRDLIDTEAKLQSVRADATAVKLDAVLAELKALREEVRRR